MKHFEVKGTVRTEFGKKAAKQIKRSNNIPCVVYGIDQTTHFTVASADVRNLIFTCKSLYDISSLAILSRAEISSA